MAKIYLNRLAKKYGIDPKNVSGENYQILMNQILARNTKNITEATAKLTDEHWTKSLSRVSTKEKRFILPNVEEVLPAKAVYIKKTADQGQLITNSLRTKLSKDLQESLLEFRTAKTDEPAFIRRRGIKAGTINPELINIFQAKIKDTFEAYTKIDPTFGVPPNIKTIAVTEARSAINDIKDAYTKDMLSKNPDMRMKKKWRQNKSLAKKPRKGHSMVNGQIIDFNEKFIVPLYNHKGEVIDNTPMERPHDPNARKEQIINCNCDIEHFAEIQEAL